jgi:TolB-like protein/tetratricopeptide (TPR) repeat protein
MSGFFEELKRRKVYRVAIAYVVASWALAQGLAQVLPVFDIPNSVIRVVIALMLIGFPVALVLAWIFDITPTGIERTSKTQSVATPTLRRRNVFWLAAAGIFISAVAGFFILPRAAAHKIDKSIAVLPFENLSDEKENAYFADGIQDDILTNLSKIGDLKVISRTSVMSYRGKAPNVREIGKALGVSSILEGSVRREGNRVRVNVQLIDATNEGHLWANNYDRDLTNVFAIQTDLAHEIADALQAKLSPVEKEQMGRKPTQNADAYLLYVQAHDIFNRTDKLHDDTVKAEGLYEEAVKKDPTFALAFAGLGMLENWMYHSFDPTPARRDKAKAAVDSAIRLRPDLPEARLALGFFYYYCDRDDQHYQRALDEFAIAQRSLPNNAEVYLAIGAIERRQGKWAQSTANMEKAAALDPKNAWVLQNLAFNYEANRDFETAEKILDRGLAAAPQSFAVRGLKAKLALEWKGDASVSEKFLSEVPAGVDPEGIVTLSRINILILQRRFAEALQLVKKMPEKTVHGEGTSPTPMAFFEAVLHFMLGEKDKALADFERARVIVEESVRDVPDDPGRHAQLGAIFAGLGRKEEAIREGKRAVELLPESKDAFDGPQVTIALAQIYCWTGEKEQALHLIERSLSTPNGINIPLLKLDPVWDPIRDDPRFKALIDKHSAKT